MGISQADGQFLSWLTAFDFENGCCFIIPISVHNKVKTFHSTALMSSHFRASSSLPPGRETNGAACLNQRFNCSAAGHPAAERPQTVVLMMRPQPELPSSVETIL